MGLDMNTPNYKSEAAWRGEMLAAQMSMRQSVRELGFLISGLFLAYLLSEYWAGLAIVVAAAMCGGAIVATWRESKAQSRLVEMMTADAELPREGAQGAKVVA
jgi:hypothetical protein